MMQAPFVLLSHEDFRRLTLDERVEYLKRAMEALKIIHDQLEEGLASALSGDRSDRRRARELGTSG